MSSGPVEAPSMPGTTSAPEEGDGQSSRSSLPAAPGRRSRRGSFDAGEERGERAGGFGLGGGEPGRERQLVDVGAGGQAGEFGEQRGVREDRRRQKAGCSPAGGRVAVVPEVRGQNAGEPGVDVGWTQPPASRVSSSRTASSPSWGSV